VAIHPATLVGDYEVPEEIADRTNLWPEVQAGTTVFRRTSRLRSRLRARRRRLAVSSRRYAAAGFWSRSANLPADEVPAALGNIVTREIDYRGSYRFIDEISQALELMAGGVDVTPLMTHEVSIDDAVRGFELAVDRSTGSSKVMIRLS
jgi:hypothetical protein